MKKSKVSVPISSWCSVLSAERPKSSKTELALPLVVRFGRAAAQILQNGPRSPSGGPFWPLSSPNPSKRTSPAWSAWLCSLLSLWWSVLAAQQPKCSKADLASLVRLAVLFALRLVSVLDAQQPKSSKRDSWGRAQPSRPSWRGPYWRIWAAERPKRTTRERKGRDSPPALV